MFHSATPRRTSFQRNGSWGPELKRLQIIRLNTPTQYRVFGAVWNGGIMRYSTIDVQLHSTKTTTHQSWRSINSPYLYGIVAKQRHTLQMINWIPECHTWSTIYHLFPVAPQRCTACLARINVWESELTASAGRLCGIVCRIKNPSNALLHHEGDSALWMAQTI